MIHLTNDITKKIEGILQKYNIDVVSFGYAECCWVLEEDTVNHKFLVYHGERGNKYNLTKHDDLIATITKLFDILIDGKYISAEISLKMYKEFMNAIFDTYYETQILRLKKK